MTSVEKISIDDLELGNITTDNSALITHIDDMDVAVDLITVIQRVHPTTLVICGRERNGLLYDLLNASPDLAYSSDITSDVSIQHSLKFCLERDPDQMLFACEDGSMTFKTFLEIS